MRLLSRLKMEIFTGIIFGLLIGFLLVIVYRQNNIIQEQSRIVKYYSEKKNILFLETLLSECFYKQDQLEVQLRASTEAEMHCVDLLQECEERHIQH